MLREHQVRFLLEHGERIVGFPLTQIRGKLKTKRQVRHAIWELVLLDSASELGPVAYEPKSATGVSPDLYLNVDSGIWLEAAYLEPRHAETLARQEAFTNHIRKTSRDAGIRPGSIQRHFHGEKVDAGFRVILPAAHELPAFFRREAVRGFFAAIAADPQRGLGLDLRAEGADVTLTYTPGPLGQVVTVGGGPVLEAPRIIEEHAIYRVLDNKGAHYRSAGLMQPLIVCIVSEENPTARRMTSPLLPSSADAIAAAFARRPLLSGVLLVSLEWRPSVFGLPTSRQAHARIYFNDRARFPLSRSGQELLMRLRFDRVDYGDSWNEWEDARTARERLLRLGGTLTYRETANGGYAVSFPAHELVHVLGGAETAEKFAAQYRFDSGENPLQRAAAEGRAIVNIRLLPHNPRGQEPQMVEIEFGGPSVLLLQVPKRKKNVQS